MTEEILWIDTDCGFDDIFAISLLDSFTSSSTNKLRIGYISTVNGMIDPVSGTAILTKMFESNRFLNKPIIYCGYNSTCCQKNSIMDVEWGVDFRQSLFQFTQEYIGNVDNKLSSNIIGQTVDKFAKIDDMVQKILIQKAQIHTLLCLGPLSNIAYIIRNYPSFLQDHVAKLVLMGK